MAIRRNELGTYRGAVVGWAACTAGAIGILLFLLLPGVVQRKYADRIPVQFWHMWTAEWKDVVERIVERFNESQTQYEVVPLLVPGNEADVKFLLSVAGGAPPDVMTEWNQVIPKWAEDGVIIPLDALMTLDEWARFQETVYPVVLKIAMYEGSLYGVTTGLDAYACYCRLDHLREAGLDPEQFPQTLERLMEWGDRLNRFNDQGELIRIGFMFSGAANEFPLFAPAFGGGFYDWKEKRLVLNSPENLAALSFLVEQRKRLGFEKVIRFTSGLATGIANVDWPFIRGAYSITVDGQWRVEQLARYAPTLEYMTAAIPPPAGGKKHAGWVNGNFMVIPRGARQVAGAWEFIKFWSGLERPERAAEFYTWGGWLPLSPDIAEAPAFREYLDKHPQLKPFLEILPSENLQPTPPVPYQVYLWDRILRADDSATRGTLTPREALDRLEREIARETDSRKRLGYDE